MKRDYTIFDAVLTSLVGKGVRKFSDMERNKELLSMATELNGGDLAAYRVIDRRLQALRKKGVIEHDAREGWILRRQ